MMDSVNAATDTAALALLASDQSPILPFRLRGAAALARIGQLTGNLHTLDAAIDRYVLLTNRVDNTAAWYGWTTTAIWKAEHGLLRQPTRHQLIRPDYLLMAEWLLRHTLEGDTGLRRASVTVAYMSLAPRRHADSAGALEAVRLIPDSLMLRDTSLLLGVARVEREAAADDSALVHFRRYVEAGGDSGVGLLEQARVLFDEKRQEEGERAWYRGVALARSETARALYRSDLEWIASPEELARFDSLPVDSLGPFLAGFWAGREAVDGRRHGERLAEHYRRWFYALRNFRLTLPWRWYGDMSAIHRLQRIVDDRGLIYIRYGEPAARASWSGGGVTLAAGAADLGPRVEDATISMLSANANQARAMTEQRASDRLEGVDTLDRVRPPPNESWRYDLPDGPLVLHFVSQAGGDYKLVESLADIFGFATGARITAGTFDLGRGIITGEDRLAFARGLFDSRSGLDPRYGVLAMNPSLGRGSALQDERARGREAVRRATTTDRYSIAFDRPLDAIVQTFALASRGRAPSRLLIEFAVPGQRVIPGGWVRGVRPFYPVEIWVRATRDGKLVAEADTLRLFTLNRELKPDQYVYGIVELPVPPGRYGLQVVLSQPLGGAGIAIRRDTVQVPGPADSLAVSDLVVGRRGSGLLWRRGEDLVALNPLNGFPRDGTAEVYWEVGGLKPAAEYTTTIEVRRQGQGGDARLALTFTDHAVSDPTPVTRTIDLKRLDPGRYTVTVRLSAGGNTTSRSVPLFITGKERYNTAQEVAMRSAPVPDAADWPHTTSSRHPFPVTAEAGPGGAARARVSRLARRIAAEGDTTWISVELVSPGAAMPSDSIDVRWIVERTTGDSARLKLADPDARRAALLLDETRGLDLGAGEYSTHEGIEIVVYHLRAAQWPAVLGARKLTALVGEDRLPLTERQVRDALADVTHRVRP